MKNFIDGFTNFLLKEGPRFLTAILFIIALVGKLVNPGPFLTAIEALSFSSKVGFIILSLTLGLEAVGILLLLWEPQFGILFSGILLILFTISLIIFYLEGTVQDCGCMGGVLAESSEIPRIFFNTGLILLLSSSYWYRKQ